MPLWFWLLAFAAAVLPLILWRWWALALVVPAAWVGWVAHNYVGETAAERRSSDVPGVFLAVLTTALLLAVFAIGLLTARAARRLRSRD